GMAANNMVSMITSIIIGFIVPAFLDLKQYSILKTYSLFVSYIGLFPLGFVDGVYIRYGGKNEKEIEKGIFKYEHNFLLIFQMLLMLIILTVSFFLKDNILVFFSLTILPFSMIGFLKLYYQAVAAFNKFAVIDISYSLLLFVCNILLVTFNMKHAITYVILNVVVYYLVYLAIELNYYKKYKNVKIKKETSVIINNFKVGIFILIGNLSSVLFYSIDRWFVKIFLPFEDFAFYSFAISMMGLINGIINSISVPFYSFFSRELRKGNNESMHGLLNKLLILGTLASGGFFVFAFVINLFMQKYIPSLKIISILFAGFPAIIIINVIYINLYKALNQERKYFYKVLLMLVISIVINIVALLLKKNIFSISIATTLSYYIWLFHSQRDFPGIRINLKQITFLVSYLVIFFISTIELNWVAGFFVYYLALGVLLFKFFREDTLLFVKRIINN
ncbi:hypothetical protein P9G49_15035, partial [Heyndrickxia coagulans]|uniref:hypothetical protein n=1 Tax=Heyndrickxia coagulans TaxID=1398 RepID=UPI002E0AB035|nr:hypothetical protein [Heyndrickxia coagulans]